MNTIHRERIWFFDFDGTLSSIVPDRDSAELHPACGKMLADLLSMPLQHVAILSSRSLSDLTARVPVKGLFLGGTSGTDWRVPGGHRMTLSGEPARMLESVRRELAPEIRSLADLPGIDVEDKNWSIALHTRNANETSRQDLALRLSVWRPGNRVRIFQGPQVYEIQLIPRINKSFGVRMLCRFMKFTPRPGTLFYAGDDENDAIAMRLVTRLGGTAVTVGERCLIPVSLVVADQQELADEVSRLANLATVPGRDRAKEARL
jgi:trehalose 6-phosphate phosphatase